MDEVNVDVTGNTLRLIKTSQAASFRTHRG